MHDDSCLFYFTADFAWNGFVMLLQFWERIPIGISGKGGIFGSADNFRTAFSLMIKVLLDAQRDSILAGDYSCNEKCVPVKYVVGEDLFVISRK